MSTSYHAHQLDQSFRPKSLNNWEVPSETIQMKPPTLERPLTGTTHFLVDNNGNRVPAYQVSSSRVPAKTEAPEAAPEAGFDNAHVVTNKLRGKPTGHPSDNYMQQTSSGRYIYYSHTLIPERPEHKGIK
mmetsp:Transcript_32035/g.38796  ORF Transcript_32035/g.38796 Transcript_32035/m.38796 type:complete len:130 (-) Transcript_32035:471-860(-)|eukprot:CAMPEP_0197848438 /NCGR_PEP_ID=MMETSP1438-20131217/8753_1 /TAXON_ID=1461541 /ORGANISM="Pterosperma sp., Strain CCMP1384" /LENGTH=129 /DNA_ID=CAMNT_0043460689 /DNA_START=245 /DNA_END=634 /DNA_ORIENTATION=+